MKRRVAPHILWQVNLTQRRELPSVLTSLILFYCSISSPDHSNCFIFVHPRVCVLIYLVARNLKQILFKLIPMACMLATLANTISHIVTKHWHCSLLCLLPHSTCNSIAKCPPFISRHISNLCPALPPYSHCPDSNSHHLFPSLQQQSPPNLPALSLTPPLYIIYFAIDI